MPRTADRLPTMLFNVNDWLTSKSVTMMTLEEQGMYMRLMCFAWLNDEPGMLEYDAELFASLLRISPEEWARHSLAIGRAWDRESRQGWWVHPRMIEERKKQLDYLDAHRENGKRGAAKRWGANDNPRLSRGHGVAMAKNSGVGVGVEVEAKESLPLPSHTAPASRVPRSRAARERSASPLTPNGNGQPPSEGKDPDDLTADEFFARFFWPEYPRKRGRLTALRMWRRVVGHGPEGGRAANRIVDALLSVSQGEWRDREEHFIPYAHTWLKQRSWEES